VKITQVEPMVPEAPVQKPWRIRTAVYTGVQPLLMCLETDESHTGYGEGLARFSPRAGAAVGAGLTLAPTGSERPPSSLLLLTAKSRGGIITLGALREIKTGAVPLERGTSCAESR